MFYLLLSSSCLSLLLLVGSVLPVQKQDRRSSVGSVGMHRVLHNLNLRLLRSADSSLRPESEVPTGDRALWAAERRSVLKHSDSSTPHFSKQESEGATEDAIILGQPQDAPYVVVIPGGEEQLLDQVQEYYPRAFLTDSRLGRYVQAGAFSTYSEAADLNDQLRGVGFDSRVVYLRVR